MEFYTKAASASGGLSGMGSSKKRTIMCSSRSELLRLKVELLSKYSTAKVMLCGADMVSSSASSEWLLNRKLFFFPSIDRAHGLFDLMSSDT